MRNKNHVAFIVVVPTASFDSPETQNMREVPCYFTCSPGRRRARYGAKLDYICCLLTTDDTETARIPFKRHVLYKRIVNYRTQELVGKKNKQHAGCVWEQFTSFVLLSTMFAC